MGKKYDNQFEEQAADAAERIDRARMQGAQLTFLPDENATPEQAEAQGERGRPPGSKNKTSNQMREWLASKGYKMPEEQLAQMAGLATHDAAIVVAMQQAEQVLAWAYDGAAFPKGSSKTPTANQRLEAFKHHYTIMLRAADALLPYGAPKATPDAGAGAPVIPVILPVAQLTHQQAVPIGLAVADGAPALSPWDQRILRDGESERKQQVSEAELIEEPDPRGKSKENVGKSDG